MQRRTSRWKNTDAAGRGNGLRNLECGLERQVDPPGDKGAGRYPFLPLPPSKKMATCGNRILTCMYQHLSPPLTVFRQIRPSQSCSLSPSAAGSPPRRPTETRSMPHLLTCTCHETSVQVHASFHVGTAPAGDQTLLTVGEQAESTSVDNWTEGKSGQDLATEHM